MLNGKLLKCFDLKDEHEMIFKNVSPSFEFLATKF